MVSFNGILNSILIGFFLVGAILLYNDNQVDQSIKATLLNGSVSHPYAAFIFVKSLDDLTPVVHPFPTDAKIFLLTEFPLFGYSHAILISILMILASFFMNHMKVKKGLQILILIALIPIGYFIASGILLLDFYLSAQHLGLTIDQAKELRQAFANHYDNFLFPFLITGGISALLVFKTIFKKAK